MKELEYLEKELVRNLTEYQKALSRNVRPISSKVAEVLKTFPLDDLIKLLPGPKEVAVIQALEEALKALQSPENREEWDHFLGSIYEGRQILAARVLHRFMYPQQDTWEHLSGFLEQAVETALSSGGESVTLQAPPVFLGFIGLPTNSFCQLSVIPLPSGRTLLIELVPEFSQRLTTEIDLTRFEMSRENLPRSVAMEYLGELRRYIASSRIQYTLPSV